MNKDQLRHALRTGPRHGAAQAIVLTALIAAPLVAAPAAFCAGADRPLPEPEHGDTITAEQAGSLPDGLVALELAGGALVAIDGTQPFPEAVVSYIQDLIPGTPNSTFDIDNPDYAALDALRAELTGIAETTGRKPATVANVGDYDDDGNLRGDGWLPQHYDELSELMMAKQAEGIFDSRNFHSAPEGAVAQLENDISQLEDPSVWEVIAPRS